MYRNSEIDSSYFPFNQEIEQYPYAMDTSQMCANCPYKLKEDYEMPDEGDGEMYRQHGYYGYGGYGRRRRRYRRPYYYPYFNPYFFPFYY
jgi:hypothetical protein